MRASQEQVRRARRTNYHRNGYAGAHTLGRPSHYASDWSRQRRREVPNEAAPAVIRGPKVARATTATSQDAARAAFYTRASVDTLRTSSLTAWRSPEDEAGASRVPLPITSRNAVRRASTASEKASGREAPTTRKTPKPTSWTT